MVRYRDVFNTSVRPIVGAAGMAAALIGISPYLHLPLFMVFSTKILLGAVTYIGLTLTMWRVAGCPQGAESYLIANARILLVRARIVTKSSS